MKAYEKKKIYRRWCAEQLKKGLVPAPGTGIFGGKGNTPDSACMSLQLGASHNRH